MGCLTYFLLSNLSSVSEISKSISFDEFSFSSVILIVIESLLDSVSYSTSGLSFISMINGFLG